VERNTLKRRLRELARRELLPVLGARDVVVRALPAAYHASFAALASECSALLRRVLEPR
jgi:ribonuclease P protein component